MTDLLPCPFCGGEAARVDIEDGENAGGSCVCCKKCNASGNLEFEFKENFITAWNTRTPTPAPNAAAVKVKPLEWVRGIVDYAKPLPGIKYISCSTTPHGCWAWWLDGDNSTRTVERDKKHAKAAAQADYAARILAAIETTPDPRDAVIARLVEALESIIGQCSIDREIIANAIAAAKEVKLLAD